MLAFDGWYDVAIPVGSQNLGGTWRFLQGDGLFANCTGTGEATSTNFGRTVTWTGTLVFK